MKRWFLVSALALSTLCFSTPAWAAVPPPLPKVQQSFDAGSMRVDVYGTPGKPALVFVPGLTCGPWEWSGEIARFSSHYTIYALTLPGFDGRPGIDGPLFQTVANDFWTMLQAHSIEKPIVVGHSLGGTLALMLATQHSDRLSRVVAVDGLPIFPGMEAQTPAQRQAAAARMQSMMAAAATPVQFEAAEKTFVLPYLMTSQTDIAAVAPLSAKSDPAASGRWAAEDTTLDLRPQLKNVTIPVLEIAPYDAALEKRMFPDAAAKRRYYESLLANDPTAKVVTIAPSRHFIMYDQPAQLDATLESQAGL